MIGDEGSHEVSAFVPSSDHGIDAGPTGDAAAGTPPVAHPVPGRVIDARWWIAALVLGAAIWAAVLSA